MRVSSTSRRVFLQSSNTYIEPLPFSPAYCPKHARSLHTSLARQSQSNDSSTSLPPSSAQVPPRWLSEVKKRIGRCVLWGLTPEQVIKAGNILKIVGRDWRELLAGSEGFLTQKGRAGLLSHNVVWGEMDSFGHVNNVTYTRYAESARVNWTRNIATHVDPKNRQAWVDLMTPKADGFILRSIRTDYKFPMEWPDRISVFHKLRKLPSPSDDSFILDVMILSERHQRPAARCLEDLVVYDYQKARKTSLPPFMLDVFAEMYKLQEEAKVQNRARVLDLLKQVEQLEKDSWDRPDAKEDLGVAA